MPNVQTRSSIGRRPTAPRSFAQYAEQLKRNDNHLFDPYDTTTLAQELLALLYPKGVPHENVVLEGFEALFRQARRNLDPSFDDQVKKRKRAVPTTTVPEAGDMLQGVMNVLNANTKMPDGRRLGQWSWGEFRSHYKAMGELLSKYADAPDNALVGDYLTI